MINDILIKNNYYIIENNFNEQFHIALYYLDENKCKAIIRRLDNNNWAQNLKIKIIDFEYDDFENISLGSSDESFKVLDIYTRIKLYKMDYNINQKIPKVIIQTSNYNSDVNIYHYNSIVSLIELNPEYEYQFFEDADCRKFIEDNFDDQNFNDDDLNGNVLEDENYGNVLEDEDYGNDVNEYLKAEEDAAILTEDEEDNNMGGSKRKSKKRHYKTKKSKKRKSKTKKSKKRQ